MKGTGGHLGPRRATRLLGPRPAVAGREEQRSSATAWVASCFRSEWETAAKDWGRRGSCQNAARLEFFPPGWRSFPPLGLPESLSQRSLLENTLPFVCYQRWMTFVWLLIPFFCVLRRTGKAHFICLLPLSKLHRLVEMPTALWNKSPQGWSLSTLTLRSWDVVVGGGGGGDWIVPARPHQTSRAPHSQPNCSTLSAVTGTVRLCLGHAPRPNCSALRTHPCHHSDCMLPSLQDFPDLPACSIAMGVTTPFSEAHRGTDKVPQTTLLNIYRL